MTSTSKRTLKTPKYANSAKTSTTSMGTYRSLKLADVPTLVEQGVAGRQVAVDLGLKLD